ncbi:MAG: SCO family protein [Chromatiales bacterium]|jgi:protein SCO1/2
MSARKRSPLQNLIIAAAAVAALLGGYYLGNLASNKQLEFKTATLLPEPKALQDFKLIDYDKEPFNLDRLKGHWNLLFFGYTNCPDICPTALASMAQVDNQLANIDRGLHEKTQVIFVSVDPQRDTPEHLKQFVSFFNPDFLAATGEQEQLKALTQQLSLQYRLQTPDEKGDYLVDHSSWLVIINPEGQFHAVISGAHYPNPEGMAADIKSIAGLY